MRCCKNTTMLHDYNNNWLMFDNAQLSNILLVLSNYYHYESDGCNL